MVETTGTFDFKVGEGTYQAYKVVGGFQSIQTWAEARSAWDWNRVVAVAQCTSRTESNFRHV